MGYDRDVRCPSELHGDKRHRVVHVLRECMHAGGDDLSGHADCRDLREECGRLLLRRLHLVVHESADLLRDVAQRRMLAHVHQQLHAGADDVRGWQVGYLHPRGQWVLGVWRTGCLYRGAPELYRRGRVGGMHVQYGSDLFELGWNLRELQHADDVRAGPPRVLLRGIKLTLRRAPKLRGSGGDGGVWLQCRSGLQRRGYSVRELEHARNVLEGRPELRIRIGDFAVRRRRVQRGRVLHQRVRSGSDSVRQRQSRNVHPGSQRLLGVRRGGRLRPAPELHRGRGDGHVHMQCRSRLRRRRQCVREFDDACDLCDRRARLRVRIVDDDVPRRRVQRGHVLHERLQRTGDMCVAEHASDVPSRAQRLHCLARLAVPQRRSLQPGGLLPQPRHAGPNDVQRHGSPNMHPGARRLLVLRHARRVCQRRVQGERVLRRLLLRVSERIRVRRRRELHVLRSASLFLGRMQYCRRPAKRTREQHKVGASDGIG